MTRDVIWAYNLDNGRPDEVINNEIKHILDTNPLVLVGLEATGFDADRYASHRMIRDRSTKSRENILVYVRRDAHYIFYDWIDCHGTWPRTEYEGVHEPRSFPWFMVNDLDMVGVHLPPNNALNAMKLQTEAIRKLNHVKADIYIGDFNGTKADSGTGKPDALARRICGRTVGERIDCAVIKRDIRVTSVSYPVRVGKPFHKVRLCSDHHHALRIGIRY